MPLNPHKILSLRVKAGLSVKEAENRAGLPLRAWERLESGRRTDPRLSTAEAVAKALGVRVDDLLKMSG